MSRTTWSRTFPERAADVETRDSADNRIALARECPEHGLADVLPRSRGEEARVRYALLLARDGQTARARELLQATLGDAERRNAAYRHMHREWVAGARRELTALG